MKTSRDRRIVASLAAGLLAGPFATLTVLIALPDSNDAPRSSRLHALACAIATTSQPRLATAACLVPPGALAPAPSPVSGPPALGIADADLPDARDLADALFATDDPTLARELARRLAAQRPALPVVERILERCSDTAIAASLTEGLTPTPEAASIIARALSANPHSNVRLFLVRECVRVDGDDGAPTSHEVVRRAAELDSDPAIRSAAVALLGSFASSTDSGELLEIVRTEGDARVRTEAVLALASARPAGALSVLEQVAAANSEPGDVRESAVLAISRWGDGEAFAALDRIAGTSSDRGVAERAQKLVERLRAEL
jgi:HEAT repeat protein